MRYPTVLITFFFVFSSIVRAQIHETAVFTKEEILSNLDSLHPYKSIPAFDLETQTFVVARAHLYADHERWAIVLEEVKPGPGGDIRTYSFGNCLMNQEKEGMYRQYLSNISFYRLISEAEFKRIVTGKYHSLISKKVSNVKVRDQVVSMEHDLKIYRKKRIPIIDYLNPKKHIDYIAMLRLFEGEHPCLLSATEEELRSLLPSNLPKLMKIDRWHFKDFYIFPTIKEDVNEEYGDKPSSYETFQLIAEILVTNDTSRWKPTLISNNHWRDQTNPQ
jgi:hypothetical protein